jgi:NTE family protein
MTAKALSTTRPVLDGQTYPRIGLALGSGAARAVCQLGLLKRLREENIPVSYVMGSSMGALIGAVYALGLDYELALEKIFHYAEFGNLNNITNFNILHESLYKKNLTEQLLNELFADFTFEDCKIPFAVTAVDLESGTSVLLNKGPLVSAIRASTSIPGIFEPVLMEGRYLVDGGLLENCPVYSLRQHGNCDLIVGVNIHDDKNRQVISGYIYKKFYKRRQQGHFLSQKIQNIKDDMTLLGAIIMRSLDILRQEVWNYRLAESAPDLMINIDIEKIGLFEFSKISGLVQIGEKIFDRHYPALRRLIAVKKKILNKKGRNVNL